MNVLRNALRSICLALCVLSSRCAPEAAFAEPTNGTAIAASRPADSRRSAGWTQLRKSMIAAHPRCAACLSKSKVVHHVQPFHVRPDLELCPTNLICLCDRCHLLVGHLGNFQSWNTNVFSDAAYWSVRILSRPLWTNETGELDERR